MSLLPSTRAKTSLPSVAPTSVTEVLSPSPMQSCGEELVPSGYGDQSCGMEDLSPMSVGRGSGLYSRRGIDVCGALAARSLCVGEAYGVRGVGSQLFALVPRLHLHCFVICTCW